MSESPPTSEPRKLGVDLAVWVARIGVAATFGYAGFIKVLDPVAFAEDIANYQAFPWWSHNLLSTVVPALELMVAAALLSGVWRRAAAWVGSALTLGFLLLIASVIFRGIDLSCGCFGASEEASSVGWPLFGRDLVLLAGCVIAGLAVREKAPQKPNTES